MEKLRFILRAAIWLPLILPFWSVAQGSGSVKPYAIKSAVYWTKPSLSRGEAASLARHSLIIIDLENMFNNYQVLLELKHLNPKAKLLCYSNPMEIYLTKYSSRSWQNKVIDELAASKSAWLLKTITPVKTADRSGWSKILDKLQPAPQQQEGYAVFWSGMVMTNMSAACPLIGGQNYSDWMAAKLLNEVLSNPIWDGYFQDNGTANISWISPGQIDINGDKKADHDALVDRYWKEGQESYLNRIRAAKGPRFIIIANKGDLNFVPTVDGKFFEKFPNDYIGEKWAGGWRKCISNASKTGEYTIFQANRANIDFVLASALLLDNVYLAISQDDAGIFPQLERDLGRPLEEMGQADGVFSRRYQRGKVTVEPLNRIGRITR